MFRNFFERIKNPKTRIVSDPALDAANRKAAEQMIQVSEPALYDIVRSLKEGAQRGEYGSVIGMDTSGRIPAMMVASALKVLSPTPIKFIQFFRGRTKKIEPSAPGIYIERPLEETSEMIAARKKTFGDAVDKHPPLKTGKVLIVDDVLEGGTTLTPLIEALREKGYEVEIAIMDDRYTLRSKGMAPRLTLTSGEEIIIHGGNSRFTPARFTGEVTGFLKNDNKPDLPYAVTEYEAFGSMHIAVRTLGRELGQKVGQRVLQE